jgi:hypothetical protein
MPKPKRGQRKTAATAVADAPVETTAAPSAAKTQPAKTVNTANARANNASIPVHSLTSADQTTAQQQRDFLIDAEQLRDLYESRCEQCRGGLDSLAMQIANQKKLTLPNGWRWIFNESYTGMIGVRSDQVAALSQFRASGNQQTMTAGGGS